MPELPDIEAYIESLRARIAGQQLRGIRLVTPLLLRTVDPPLSSADGRKVGAIRRLGKRIVLGLTDDLFLVLHLMMCST